MPLAASLASAACVARHHAGAVASSPAVAAPVAAPVASSPAVVAPVAAPIAAPVAAPAAIASPAPQKQQVSAAAGKTGTSTFYGGNLQGGTCSFSTYSLPAGIYGTAFSGEAWNLGAKCGSCLEVTAKGKTIKVMVSFTSP